MSKIYSCCGVTMNYKDNSFIVETISAKDGTQSVAKFDNAVLAKNLFFGQAEYNMSIKMRKWLKSQGKNEYTGCDQLELNCHDCKLTGEYRKHNCPIADSYCEGVEKIETYIST